MLSLQPYESGMGVEKNPAPTAKRGKLFVTNDIPPKRKTSLFKTSDVSRIDSRVIPGRRASVVSIHLKPFKKSLDLTPSSSSLSGLDQLVFPSQNEYLVLVIGEKGSGANALAGRFLGEKVSPQARAVVPCGDKYITATVRVFAALDQIPISELQQACGLVFVATTVESSELKRLANMRNNVPLSLPSVIVISRQDALSRDNRGVSKLDFANRANELGFTHAYMTSALTGRNVHEAFGQVLRQAQLQRRQPQKQSRLHRRCAIS
ncbi:hypothetical protein BASA81_004221 [Batrachochytrium salamandrivorans]|nr:hypothetical protein BASA81_004221 [Batrachochytrium salamandrivorans]